MAAAPQTHILIIADTAVIAKRIRRLLERVHSASYTSVAADKAKEVILASDFHLVVLVDLLSHNPNPLSLLFNIQKHINVIAFDSLAEANARQVASQISNAQLNLVSVLPLPCPNARLQSVMERMTDDLQAGKLGQTPRSVGEIETAIAQGLIIPWYQPKISTLTAELTGFEALARWQEANGDIIHPSTFITVAENHSIIHILTRQILTDVITQLRDWWVDGHEWQISVNASVDDLESDDFVTWLGDSIERAGIPGSALIIEVTESRVSKNFAVLLYNLTQLKKMGIGLAIDDFGTGYASLQQLNRMPFTELKIDQSFVTGAHLDKDKRVILENSVSIGHGLGLEVVAEGIETGEDWWHVRKCGVDIGQGWFIGRPMAASNVLNWVKDWETRAEYFVDPPTLTSQLKRWLSSWIRH